MIRLLKAGVRTGLVAVAIAAAFPMIAYAQTTEPAIERAPAAGKAAVGSAGPTGDGSGTDNDTSAQTPPPARAAIPAVVEVEIKSRFNELRRELLDDRAKTIDWWLAATAMFLTLLGIVAVIAGYLSFKRFHEIVVEAYRNVTASKQHAEEARSLVEEIKANRDEFNSVLKGYNAETVGNNPDEAGKAAKNVQGNPAASLIEQAIAATVLFQRQGEIEKAVEKWRAVAHVAEGSDNELAARAWFSVGYLAGDKSPEECISANDRAIHLKPDHAEAYNNRGNAKRALERHDEAIADYDQAVRLKPDFAAAYYNRGNAKRALERHDEAIADYDQAVRLKPDFAEAYYNRGKAKAVLGLKDEARKDFETALELAQKAGNANIVALAEQSLRGLDADGGR